MAKKGEPEFGDDMQNALHLRNNISVATYV